MTPVIEWRWRPLANPSGYEGAATYAVRLLNHGKVVSISRFLGCDEEGILTIGKSKHLEQRRQKFFGAISKGSGHSAGNLLKILASLSVFQQRFSKVTYEFAFIPAASDEAARRREDELTKNYLERYGEAPPLVSVIPNRYLGLVAAPKAA